MTPAARDLFARLDAFSPDGPDLPALPFAARLAREQGWTRAFAERAVHEYKRFVFLAMTVGRPMCPSEQIDAVWHQHLTYTRNYWNRFCKETLGRPLHHEPTRGGGDEADKHWKMYADTLAAYREAFGHEPPSDVWPPAEQRFGEDTQHVVVNPARNWIISKAWARRTATVAGVMLAVAAGLGCGGLNPFELKGIEFIAFLVPLLIAAAAVGLVIRNAMSGPAAEPNEPIRDFTWTEAALLAGQGGRLLDASIARLIHGGVARVSPSGNRLQQEGLPTRPLTPVEQLVCDSLPLDKTDRKAVAKLRTEIDARAGEEEARLLNEGLILEAGRAKTIGRLAFLPYALVAFGLGGSRLVMGLSNHKPTLYLFFTLFVAFIVGAWLFGRRLHRTHKGEAVLKHLQRKRANLNGMESASDPGLAVALFGTAALMGAEFAALHQWFPKPTSGSGCGSGCSTGGGGGCGSGCGGCGGGD